VITTIGKNIAFGIFILPCRKNTYASRMRPLKRLCQKVRPIGVPPAVMAIFPRVKLRPHARPRIIRIKKFTAKVS